MGKVPTISINKTDGCHVYLSQDSLKCEIVSAKSSEMNILVPNKDGEFVSVSDFRLFCRGSFNVTQTGRQLTERQPDHKVFQCCCRVTLQLFNHGDRSPDKGCF